jgi:hypothetical protein
MADPVARGPLVARWLDCELEEHRAGALGAAIVEVENAGSATWRAGLGTGVNLAYHWLDLRGNPIVWDGIRTPLARPVEPGERVRATMTVRAPVPPGRYRLAIDLVDEQRAWFADVGSPTLELERPVQPRIERALAVRGGDPVALAAQQEALVPEADAAAVAFLADGCFPAPDWSRRVLDAHQEGFALVGGSIAADRRPFRRGRRSLTPWAPGTGRVPGFPHPLLCPSAVRGVEPEWVDEVEGLPAARAPGGEPWLYDGRIAIRLARRD